MAFVAVLYEYYNGEFEDFLQRNGHTRDCCLESRLGHVLRNPPPLFTIFGPVDIELLGRNMTLGSGSSISRAFDGKALYVRRHAISGALHKCGRLRLHKAPHLLIPREALVHQPDGPHPSNLPALWRQPHRFLNHPLATWNRPVL